MFNLFGLLYTFLFMVLLYYTVERYSYIQNVLIYTIGRGLIPAIFPFSGIHQILTGVITCFVIGLGFVKLFEFFTANLDNYWLISMVGTIIELILSLCITFVFAGIM